MTLVLSFWVSLCLVWAFCLHILSPVPPTHGPWTLQSMGALKHRELMTYLGLNVALPVITIFFDFMTHVVKIFLRRRAASEQSLVVAYPWLPYTAWLAVPLFLRYHPAGFVTLFFWPAALALIIAGFGLRLRKSPTNRPADVLRASPSVKPLWVTMVVGVLLTAVFFYALPRSLPTGMVAEADDGLRLDAEQQWEFGAVPYRDIYFQYGPGIELVEPWIAFHLWDRSWTAHRRLLLWIDAAGGIAAGILMLASLRRVGFILLLMLVFLGRPDLLITHRLTFPFLAFTAAIVGQRLPRGGIFWALSGILSMLALFHSIEGGLFATASLVSFLTLVGLDPSQRQRVIANALAYVGGIAIVFVPVLLWLLWRQAVPPFLDNTFLIGHSVMGAWGKPTPPLLAPLADWAADPAHLFAPLAVWSRWWFPFILYSVTLAWGLRAILKQRWSPEMAPRLLLALAGIFFGIVVMGRTDFDHWRKAIVPFWLLSICWMEAGYAGAIWSAVQRRWGTFMVTSVALLVGVGLVFYGFNVQTLIEKWTARPFELARSTEPAISRLGDGFIDPPQKAILTQATQAISRHAAPGQFVYIFADYPVYYFLADVRNPTRYSTLALIASPKMADDALRSLNAHPPVAVLATLTRGKISCRSFQQPVADWIEARYHYAEKAGDLDLLVPRTAVLPSAHAGIEKRDLL